MNPSPETHMDPLDILHAVRKGFALATPQQMELLCNCRGLEVLHGSWVPRWTLEAEESLKKAGCAPARVRELIELGHAEVNAELARLVSEGRLAHVLESRVPARRMGIDLPTEMALTHAVQQHRAGCAQCQLGKPCGDGEDLEDELEMLFPRERRQHQRA